MSESNETNGGVQHEQAEAEPAVNRVKEAVEVLTADRERRRAKVLALIQQACNDQNCVPYARPLLELDEHGRLVVTAGFDVLAR